MRIIYMGTPEFAVLALDKLFEAGHEVCAVFTQPDRPKGRGNQLEASPVKKRALTLGLTVYQPEKVRKPEMVTLIKDLNPDVIVVAAFGQILPQSILDIPRYGCVCIHASILPKYRGAAPIQWAIIQGEEESGITIMQMDAGIDTGDMLLKESVKIEPSDTGGSLHDKLVNISGDLVVKALEMMELGTLIPEKQDDSKQFYASMLTKELGRINWSEDGVYIERLIRGLNPWPSAYTKLNGKTLKIWRAQVILESYEGKEGEVVAVTKDSMVIQTGNGALALLEVQLEGKKRMLIEDFLRGVSIEKGSLLG